MCRHENAIIKKYPIGCGHYVDYPDCGLTGEYANSREEAKYKFNEMVKNETMDTRD